MTHICVVNLTIMGSDNGVSPGRFQAITWTNVGILLIGPLGTNLNAMLITIHTFSFKKIHLQMSSGKWRPFCLGLNVSMQYVNANWRSYALAAAAWYGSNTLVYAPDTQLIIYHRYAQNFVWHLTRFCNQRNSYNGFNITRYIVDKSVTIFGAEFQSF